MFECEFCHTLHRYPISAALCCDVVSNTLDDENPDVSLGYD